MTAQFESSSRGEPELDLDEADDERDEEDLRVAGGLCRLEPPALPRRDAER
jgi:hypothetical protein